MAEPTVRSFSSTLSAPRISVHKIEEANVTYRYLYVVVEDQMVSHKRTNTELIMYQIYELPDMLYSGSIA